MTTLVTGAAGFVGSAVARCLLDDGHDVRALVRPTSDLRNLENMPVEHEPQGDFKRAGRHCRTCAAPVSYAPLSRCACGLRF
ncbi:MAG: NAD-dependent epimerase/dehydratase family protein [Deltaproteobacteria bacterium]|nr:NAD-dependent epimerase/dehydratase family protein [Deltaproteobacteria bacterium]